MMRNQVKLENLTELTYSYLYYLIRTLDTTVKTSKVSTSGL